MKRASEGRVPELRCCRLASHRVSARHRDKAQATAPQILLCLAGVAIGSLFVLELHRTATTPDEVGRAERLHAEKNPVNGVCIMKILLVLAVWESAISKRKQSLEPWSIYNELGVA